MNAAEQTEQPKSNSVDSSSRAGSLAHGARAHTPGPWQIVTTELPHYLGGKHVERRIFTTWIHPQLKDGIGVVNGSIGIPEKKGDKAVSFVHIEEADARLIAAAPDLLSALREVIDEHQRLTGDTTPAVNRARAAIALATAPSKASAEAPKAE